MLESKNDTIFIGKKPLMTYVTSALIQLSGLPSISLKARGLSIGLAVDVANIIMRKANAFDIKNIIIGSESLESPDGRKRDVSTIEISISRKTNPEV